MKKWPLLVSLLVVLSCMQTTINTKVTGTVFGTSYNIIYDSEENYQKAFDSLFYVINKSMSTYQTNSDISKLNRNESKEVDDHFKKVLQVSKRLHSQTDGVFDPTIGTIVNALGFGPEQRIERLDSIKIDSLMQFVGLGNIFNEDRFVFKKHPETYIDFNAIAKGYAVDIIANFLEAQKITHYLVEIGGEIRTSGINMERDSEWTVGIDKPNFDGTQSVLKAITLSDCAMATSGTYRKFKIDKQGKRYAHIIDAKTGYPSKSNLLSVSVIAPNCISADAYATAFQAMGVEKVKDFASYHPELKIFMIFENDKKELETLALNEFPTE